MTTVPNVADPVKLAAIKDALDRSELAAKNAVSVEVAITKPWKPFSRESPQITSGPRDSENPPAPVRLPELDAAIDTDADIVGEFDDDEIEDDLPRIQRERESESADPRIIDVEIESLGPAHYTDEIMSDDPAPLHRTSQILRSVGRSARRILAIRSNGTGGVGVDVIVGRGWGSSIYAGTRGGAHPRHAMAVNYQGAQRVWIGVVALITRGPHE